jgi:ornithine cyclodeaminase/alanine dehydrogenase-like protein (mu-crystallin family)
MIHAVSETVARQLVSLRDTIGLMEAAFASLDRGESQVFPFVAGHGSDPATRFGAKLGYDGVRRLPGVKIGTYWPGNAAKGIGNHGSNTLLLDNDTGLPIALVAATHLTALRTAASNAVAVRHLARQDASVLAIVGPGHQAYWDARAIAEVRTLERILVGGRRAVAAEALAERLRGDGLPAEASELSPALARADIISTATGSRAPLFAAAEVRPGVHISAAGADGPGKQELDPALAARASLWADLPSQSVALGEFQYLGASGVHRVQPIGGLLAGRLPGRQTDDEITVYDSSGIGLQDVAICAFALERALAEGLAISLDLS